jgi:peptidoglycan/LPS O-acetylase OafA/YrhL
MNDAPDNGRYEKFVADVQALRPESAKLDRDVVGARVGAALLAAGIAIGVVAYLISHRTTDPLTQGDAIVIAGIAACVSIAGAALYLRHGLSHFLRLWLARLIFENAAARGIAPVVTDAASCNGTAPVEATEPHVRTEGSS